MTVPREAATLVHNPGAPFDRGWILAAAVDDAAVARRAAELAAEPFPSAGQRIDALLAAVAGLDLTTLAGDDTPARVEQLCAVARQPLPVDLLAALGRSGESRPVAAACVYPALVPTVARALADSSVAVCSVAGGFPAGQLPLALKVAEIAWAVAAGATELDVVISRAHALTGDWAALYDEVRAFKAACGHAGLKVILSAGELGSLDQVARASRTCLLAGADVIKTSTGKEQDKATLPIGLVMVRALRDYFAHTGHVAGLKPAGGIRTAADVLAWRALAGAELGTEWLGADRFRIGASSVLADIEHNLAALARA